MRVQFVLIGSVFIVVAISLRIASYILQFTPIEPTGFGVTLPLDASIASFGALLFLIGLDPALITNRVRIYWSTYREIRRNRKYSHEDTDNDCNL